MTNIDIRRDELLETSDEEEEIQQTQNAYEIINYEELEWNMEMYAVRENFQLSKSNHQMDTFRATKIFGKQEKKVYQRGNFKCNYKKQLDIGKVRSSCLFNVSYTFDFKKKHYYIKEEKYNISHNHPTRTKVKVDKREHVTSIKDLKEYEKQDIMDLGIYLPIHKLRQILRLKYPTKEYGTNVLLHIKRLETKKYKGNDINSMEKLFKKGKEYETGGGIHDMHMDAQCRLSDLI